MLPVGAIIGAGTAIAGGIQAGIGAHRQKKLDKNRPVYEIPEEIRQNLTQAQQQAQQGIPEEYKQQFLSNLERGSAQALQGISSRKGGLIGIGALNQQQNDAYANLMSTDAQARMQNQGALMNQRQQMADYKDQAFEFNKVNPYNRASDRNQALIGAGMQNISSGLQMGLGGMGSMFGNQTPQAQPPQQPNPFAGGGAGYGNYQYAGQQYGNTG